MVEIHDCAATVNPDLIGIKSENETLFKNPEQEFSSGESFSARGIFLWFASSPQVACFEYADLYKNRR